MVRALGLDMTRRLLDINGAYIVVTITFDKYSTPDMTVK